MYRRLFSVTAAAATVIAMSASPALADHDHFIVTPNGQCHQVAHGQTSIADKFHGGHHRFHQNVHFGATEDDTNKTLGHGNARVEVYKDACP